MLKDPKDRRPCPTAPKIFENAMDSMKVGGKGAGGPSSADI